MRHIPIRDRFDAKYAVDVSGCWIWTAHLFRTGYGCFQVARRTRSAHRVSYELHCGPIPDGMHVLHRCDVTRCVNPDHLFLGTALDNMRDKVKKGRFSRAGGGQRGEKSGKSVLKESQVLEILDLSSQKVPYRKIAANFGISPGAVWSIITRKTWIHLPRPQVAS